MFSRDLAERHSNFSWNDRKGEEIVSRNYVYGREMFGNKSKKLPQPKFFYEIFVRDGKYALAKPGREFLTAFEYDRIYPIAEGPNFNALALEAGGREDYTLIEEDCDYHDVVRHNVLLFDLIPTELFGEELKDFSLKILDESYRNFMSVGIYNIIEATIGQRYDEDLACEIVNDARSKKNCIRKSIEEKHEEFKKLAGQREDE